jgi:hypothetical protein
MFLLIWVKAYVNLEAVEIREMKAKPKAGSVSRGLQ